MDDRSLMPILIDVWDISMDGIRYVKGLLMMSTAHHKRHYLSTCIVVVTLFVHMVTGRPTRYSRAEFRGFNELCSCKSWVSDTYNPVSDE
ncbi:hypothetical protein CDAR_261161 [Caerostris darwini]|uniref:Uncharacterized protein n=1 Tax=Caerostris darwini TaxID=1538125 RepID=A0AAV4P6P1_9ARAC|nr:hypothetical protein CDAR_102841 [Caerostris darwini]GIY33124.1 hypothetical protein CDAR_261161 [Caerostris darwini]